jgi:poly-beta-1,6-N-acetyl-D-glucosamine synthase
VEKNRQRFYGALRVNTKEAGGGRSFKVKNFEDMIYLAAGCALLLCYSYIGFPLLVALRARLRPRAWRVDETYRPTVSIILPVFNEAIVLRRCLESLLRLNYPADRLEILCGSDGSSDSTNSILEEMAKNHPILHPFYFERQRGKMLTLNDIAIHARNEILLFVDADVTLNPNAVLSHVRNYIDNSVGGVAGRLVIAADRTDGIYRSESTFLSFESSLRRNEAEIGSTVGLYGGNYSMRRQLWKPLPDDRVYDDFFAVLTIIHSGHRLLYEEGAISTELYARNYREEAARKQRNASRCLYTMRLLREPLFRGPAAWMLWPHKLLRWFTGFLALGLLAGTIAGMIESNDWALPLLLIEAVSFLLILIGAFARNARRPVPFASGLYWFFSMNVAFMFGVLEFLRSRQQPIWAQTTRFASQHPTVITEEAIHS